MHRHAFMPSFLLALGLMPLAAAADVGLPPELPLGRLALPEQRTIDEIRPGLLHARILRGTAETDDGFLLEGSPLRDAEAARKQVSALKDQGFAARLDRASENTDEGAPAYIVRADGFASRDEAKARLDAFKAITGSAAFRELADTGEPDIDGPWIVNILAVDLAAYPGRAIVKLAGDTVPGGADVPTIAAEVANVDAAVNASYFVFRDDWGSTTGRPAGLFMENGRLAAESVDGRPVLALAKGKAGILGDVRTRVSLDFGGETLIADGVNRKPGRVVNCGNPGDTQGEEAAHDFFCDDPDEIVVFDALYGETSDEGDGVEAVVENGRVTALRDRRGGSVPADGFTIQATGADAERLRNLAYAGAGIERRLSITSRGAPLDTAAWSHIINGGPTLVENGQLPSPARRKAEGWGERFGNQDRLGNYYGWVLRRHPRTAAGISADGRTLYLVTVDGRQPGVSVGATITEMSRLMQSIGAEQAINLDGGGSTTLVIGGELANTSSDPAPRAVSDAILLVGEGR